MNFFATVRKDSSGSAGQTTELLGENPEIYGDFPVGTENGIRLAENTGMFYMRSPACLSAAALLAAVNDPHASS